MFLSVTTSAVAAMGGLFGLRVYFKGGDVALAVADADLRAKFDVREHYFQRLLVWLLMGTVLITALLRYAEKYRKEEWKKLAQEAPRFHARITKSFSSVSDLSESGLDALESLPTPTDTVTSTIVTLSSITSSYTSSQLSITSSEDDASTAPSSWSSWCGGGLLGGLFGGLFGALFLVLRLLLALVRCVFLCGVWMVGVLFWILFTVLRWAVFLIGQPIVWSLALCDYISRVVARVVGFFFKTAVGVVQMTIDAIIFLLAAALLFMLVRRFILSMCNFDLVTLDVYTLQLLHVVGLAITDTMELSKLRNEGTLAPQIFEVMLRHKLQGHWTTILNLEQALN